MRPNKIKKRINLRKALFILPNAFTLSSIFCGMYAIWVGLTGNTPETLYQAGIAIFFAGFFDAFDGRVARLTKTQSDLGVQLDSLADLISFGVAPAMLVYKWALWPLGWVGFLGIFLFTACGAIRLARFNISASNEAADPNFFLGIPIPLAGSLLVASLITHLKLFDGAMVKHPEWILILVILVGLLMISSIPYWSFKNYKISRQSLVIALALILVAWWIKLHYPISVMLVALLGFYMIAGLARHFFIRVYFSPKEK